MLEKMDMLYEMKRIELVHPGSILPPLPPPSPPEAWEEERNGKKRLV